MVNVKSFFPQVTTNELDLFRSQLQALVKEMKDIKAQNLDMTANYNTLRLKNKNGM